MGPSSKRPQLVPPQALEGPLLALLPQLSCSGGSQTRPRYVRIRQARRPSRGNRDTSALALPERVGKRPVSRGAIEANKARSESSDGRHSHLAALVHHRRRCDRPGRGIRLTSSCSPLRHKASDRIVLLRVLLCKFCKLVPQLHHLGLGRLKLAQNATEGNLVLASAARHTWRCFSVSSTRIM